MTSPADFASLGVSALFLPVLEELGHKSPTPIQIASIPVLLAGDDLVGQAETGSGKTAAFGLPMLQAIDVKRRSVQGLVVCPTRELCAQVARELRRLGRRCDGLRVVSIAGGEPIRPQIAALERGVHIVVGTPGRLLDHLQRRAVVLSGVAIAVLDEADRMLDMGFQKDVETILAALPKSRQTAFFSATFPPTIEAMVEAHQRGPVRVSVGGSEQMLPKIRQMVLPAESGNKLLALFWVLNRFAHESVLIFCNLKAAAAGLDSDMASFGLSVACLHGDLDQFHRDQVLARFRNRSVRTLVATDVIGRGIDIDDLNLVVNYDMPDHAKTYIHRIGRTGRAGKEGLAVSIATAKDLGKLRAIAASTGSRMEELPTLVGGDKDMQALAESLAGSAAMETILISGGRRDKMRPGDILGALTGTGGLDAAHVGKIEIQDHISYVAVARDVSRRAVQSLNNGRIKGKRFRATLVQ